MNVLICSFNVRGLGNNSKREQILSWIKEKISISAFYKKPTLPRKQIMYGNNNGIALPFLVAKNQKNEGIGILINSKFSCDIINYTDIITGRLQALDIKVNNKEITIINIYGPNKDNSAVFDKLENYIINNEEKTFIIGGDYNTVLDPNIDKKNGKTETHRACRQWSYKRSPDYCPGITTTMKNKKHCCKSFLNVQ